MKTNGQVWPRITLTELIPAGARIKLFPVSKIQEYTMTK